MPSASSVKLEKQQSSNAIAMEIVDNTVPIRQVIVCAEHKIRNLEKRKAKLETYIEIEKSGKELSNDQKIAISKYAEVTHTLEFAREFAKQIVQIATVSEKELKKKQKKDEITKRQNEISKIREVLIIQDILNLLSDNEIREDFLSGSNGACKLDAADLDILDKFHSEVHPKRPNGSEEVPFKTAAQKSADHLLLTIDGKPKEFAESKYTVVKTILKNIQKCGYFDKAAQPPPEEVNVSEPSNESNNTDVQPLEQDTSVETEIVSQEFQEAPPATSVPVPQFTPQHLIPIQPTQVPLGQPLVPVVGITRTTVPTVSIPPHGQIHPQQLPTVQAVEQSYFKHHQYNIRPIDDVIGKGNFSFLQDSELDSPAVVTTNYQQQQPQLPPPQISPNQPVTQQLPPQQGLPSQPQMSPAAQITTQTFNNPSFQNIVQTPIYAAKPIDVPPNHIPGFATAVAVAVPPIVQTVIPNHHQTQPSTQISVNPNPLHTNNVPSSAPMAYPQIGKFIAPNVSTVPHNLPKEKRHHTKETKQIENEQRVPEISEWKAEDANKPQDWCGDWNEETAEDSTLSNSQRYQYRNNGGGGGGTGNGSRERNNRGGPRPSGGSGSNFRNRQTNGRQSGNGGGGNERGGNGNTFYRNNDNFYPNGGNYKQDKQEGGYRNDNKQDGGFRSGNFRSRDSRDQINGGSMRSGGPRNSQRNSDSVERERGGTNRNATQNSRSANNKGGNSYGSGGRHSAPTGNNTRPQSAVNA